MRKRLSQNPRVRATTHRHARQSGDPTGRGSWIPAFAGMTFRFQSSKRSRVLCVSVLLALIAGACSDQGTTEPPPSASLADNSYDNPLLGIAITVADTWCTAIDTVVGDEPLLLYACSDGTDSALSLSLVRKTDLEELTDNPFTAAGLVKVGLEQRFADLTLVLNDTVVVDSVACADIVFEATVNAARTRSRLIYIVHNGCHIILTFTAKAAVFDSHTAAAAAVIESAALY